MATNTYIKERRFSENNPGLNPELRAYHKALNSVVTWPTTTTTTTTTTTSSTTTTTTT